MKTVLIIKIDNSSKVLTATYAVEPEGTETILECNDRVQRFKDALLYIHKMDSPAKPQMKRKARKINQTKKK
jgi:hypothetical protein